MQEWAMEYPLIESMRDLKPVTWINPFAKKEETDRSFPLTKMDIIEAEKLWQRFAPYLAKAFPETKPLNGIIESPLREISHFKEALEKHHHETLPGTFYLKCDHELPISGSVKARGGVFEVLKHAEKLALENGMITKEDNYEKFMEPQFKQFFKQYTIGVGSTGNLALSIGTISAELGFTVDVHMSSDAKQWKKDLLRKKGVRVHEYDGDFSVAITQGREKTEEDPNGYFVDDEDSKALFLGYSVAALRLKAQLDVKQITVDEKHPLVVYLPCGVGGSPGGIAFGLKQVFGDAVHCIFVEPTHSPSVLLGMMTERHEKLCVQDFGIDNKTEADGLAVGRPSRFATEISQKLVGGAYTIEDDELYKLLTMLADREGIYVEPSAAAGLIGPLKLMQSGYVKEYGLESQLINGTHIAWSTGGALVPEEEMKVFYEKGKSLLRR
ncbi:D-serine ammonia-lyase [Halobacillus yeomjeoni]|uniref:Probable D-serine dehydratase n=1 Tax=Halobacillus yeomjeoni TaxID=311194 RepID=A0A931MW26_9BACI|nr:D-serine ammonia-lyase [Halobacillus yeomjeoni]MBH0231297.1 D-serine ammonia-lyase [Halobacillus yeomjeoni]